MSCNAVNILKNAPRFWLPFVVICMANAQGNLCTLAEFDLPNPYDEETVVQIAATNKILLDECLLGLAIRSQCYSWSWSSEILQGNNGYIFEKNRIRRVSPPDEFERIRLAQRYLALGADPNACVKTTMNVFCTYKNKPTHLTYSSGSSVAILALQSGFERLASVIYNSTNSNQIYLSQKNKQDAVCFAQTNSCYLFLELIRE